MKTFDIDTFEENKVNNKLNDSIKIEQTEWENEYMSVSKMENSLFENKERYFKNGKLKSISEMFSNSFIASYKEYNEDGEIVESINYNKPFTYSWDDVKKYLEVHKVEDIQKQVIGISRWSDESSTTWTLEFNGSLSKNPFWRIQYMDTYL